jgi:hypothetical protein
MTDRIFWATQGVLLNGSFLGGVQSVGVNSSHSASALFNNGSPTRRHIFYNRPSTEITIERLLTGAPAEVDDGVAAGEHDIEIAYGSDENGNIGENSSLGGVQYKKCLISSISYSMSVDRVTETVTYINRWMEPGGASPSDFSGVGGGGGETMKRQHIKPQSSTLPEEVKKLFDIGTELNGIDVLGLQSIDINVNIERTQLLDHGYWGGSDGDLSRINEFYIPNLPISISCSFRGIIRQPIPWTGIMKNLDNAVRPVDNNFTQSYGGPAANPFYEADRVIVINSEFSGSNSSWNLGAKNYLTSIETNGGDAGDDSNVEVTITYQNSNNFIEVS